MAETTHRERAGELVRWVDQVLKRHRFALPAIERRDLVDALEELQDAAVGDYANAVEAARPVVRLVSPSAATTTGPMVGFRDSLGWPG